MARLGLEQRPDLGHREPTLEQPLLGDVKNAPEVVSSVFGALEAQYILRLDNEAVRLAKAQRQGSLSELDRCDWGQLDFLELDDVLTDPTGVGAKGLSRLDDFLDRPARVPDTDRLDKAVTDDHAVRADHPPQASLEFAGGFAVMGIGEEHTRIFATPLLGGDIAGSDNQLMFTGVERTQASASLAGFSHSPVISLERIHQLAGVKETVLLGEPGTGRESECSRSCVSEQLFSCCLHIRVIGLGVD